MSGLLAALLVMLEIHAAGDCPGAADVERQLLPLLGADAATTLTLTDMATIKTAPDGTLLVSLDDADGRPIGSRRFPRAPTCGEQAQTIAVTLAIWEAQIHPEFSLRLDRLSPETGPDARPAPPGLAATPLATVGARPAGAAISVGVAAAGDWQSGSWAPAGRAEVALGRVDSHWRARLTFVGVGRHTMDVPPGTATWRRLSASLGADYDVSRGRRWAVVIGGGAVGGVVSISGSGYAVNRTSRSIDAGAEIGMRGEWRPGHLRPWVGVFLTAWLRRQTLDLGDVATSSALPRLEPVVALGADFVW